MCVWPWGAQKPQKLHEYFSFLWRNLLFLNTLEKAKWLVGALTTWSLIEERRRGRSISCFLFDSSQCGKYIWGYIFFYISISVAYNFLSFVDAKIKIIWLSQTYLKSFFFRGNRKIEFMLRNCFKCIHSYLRNKSCSMGLCAFTR